MSCRWLGNVGSSTVRAVAASSTTAPIRSTAGSRHGEGVASVVGGARSESAACSAALGTHASRRPPSTSAITPITTKGSRRPPRSNSTPPRAGPSRLPADTAKKARPMARPRPASSQSSASSAKPAVHVTPAATPCSARPTVSHSRLRENAKSAVVATSAASPAAKGPRGPSLSTSPPMSGVATTSPTA